MNLIPGWVKLLVLAGVVLLAVGACHHRDAGLIEQGRKEQIDAQAAADKIESDRRAEEAKEIDREAKRMQAQAERDRADSDRAHGQLRADVATFVERHRAATAGNLTPAGRDPLDLFAELYTGMDARGRELARFADAAHRAGLGCERQYQSLTGAKP